MATRDLPFSDPKVEAAFAAFAPKIGAKLLYLRGLIMDAGDVTESLKWGQPSYDAGKDGTPIRLGTGKAANSFGFYVHCQTDLIAQFETLYGDQLSYTGTRGVLFDLASPLPGNVLTHCFKLALTYHARKR